MGINGFRGWLDYQFPNAITKLKLKSFNKGSQRLNENKGVTILTKDNLAHCTKYDHVLIDVNELLHQVVRKGVSHDHSIKLLMKNLDDVVRNVAIPQVSLVLAMDGSASAAKITEQKIRRENLRRKRNRREMKYQTLTTAETASSIPQHQMQSNIGNNYESTAPSYARTSVTDTKSENQRGKLCRQMITPGTEFMTLAEQAILYWAYQQMSSPNLKLNHGLSIYVSSSSVPGEGEIKLLEWIYTNLRTKPTDKASDNQQRQQQQHHQKLHTSSTRGGNDDTPTIALLGGDSDLILEAWMIPMDYAKNVHVILPEEGRRYLVVDLLKMDTIIRKNLVQSCHQQKQEQHNQTLSLSEQDMMHIRTDLALISILNGNDYLPKLRGSRGFGWLYQSYIALQRQTKTNAHVAQSSSLVNPETLEYNIEYCIQYFEHLAKMLPPSGFMDSTQDNQNSNQHQADDVDAYDRLTIGDDNSNIDEECDTYNQCDIDDDIDNSEVSDNTTLAQGIEVVNTDYSSGKDGNIQYRVEADVERYLYGLLWNLQTYQDGVCADYGYNYGRRKAPTALDVVTYFKQKLQQVAPASTNNWDGTTTTATTIGIYELAYRCNRRCSISSEVGSGDGDRIDNQPVFHQQGEMLSSSQMMMLTPMSFFTGPVSAGVACLAALPFQMRHLVPEPYHSIPNKLVDSIYKQCLDPYDHWLNMKEFEKLCNKQVHQQQQQQHSSSAHSMLSTGSETNHSYNTNIEHYWTQISKTDNKRNKNAAMLKTSSHISMTTLPKPFCKNVKSLRPNNNIFLHQIPAWSVPRHRTPIMMSTVDFSIINCNNNNFNIPVYNKDNNDGNPENKNRDVVVDESLSLMLEKQHFFTTANATVMQATKTNEAMVCTKVVLSSQSNRSNSRNNNNQVLKARPKLSSSALKSSSLPSSLKEHSEITTNKDGVKSLSILNQLRDVGFVCKILWEFTDIEDESLKLEFPIHENIRLTVHSVVPPTAHAIQQNRPDDNDANEKDIFCSEIRSKNTKRSNDEIPSTVTAAVYESIRAKPFTSRKSIQHLLSSMALTDLVRKSSDSSSTVSWYDMSFRELQNVLSSSLHSLPLTPASRSPCSAGVSNVITMSKNYSFELTNNSTIATGTNNTTTTTTTKSKTAKSKKKQQAREEYVVTLRSPPSSKMQKSNGSTILDSWSTVSGDVSGTGIPPDNSFIGENNNSMNNNQSAEVIQLNYRNNKISSNKNEDCLDAALAPLNTLSNQSYSLPLLYEEKRHIVAAPLPKTTNLTTSMSPKKVSKIKKQSIKSNNFTSTHKNPMLAPAEITMSCTKESTDDKESRISAKSSTDKATSPTITSTLSKERHKSAKKRVLLPESSKVTKKNCTADARNVKLLSTKTSTSTHNSLVKEKLPRTTLTTTTVDGITAVAVLNQLSDANLVGDVKWEWYNSSVGETQQKQVLHSKKRCKDVINSYQPNKLGDKLRLVMSDRTNTYSFSASSPIRVSTKMSQNVVCNESDDCYNCIKNDNVKNIPLLQTVKGKKSRQQHLASIALRSIVSKQWYRMTFKELKAHVASSSKDGRTSMTTNTNITSH